LDADDWYQRNTLKVMVRKMNHTSKKVAMCYGNEKKWRLTKKGKIKFVKKRKKRQIKDKYDLITYRPMVYPRFYRTKALRRVGGWSTNVPYHGRYAEDRQILLKLAGKYRFKWINKALYNRLEHGSNNSRRANARKYAKVTRYLYKKALKRWGKKYKAKFKWVKGRLKVVKLKRRKK
jgi:hypothetical protein